MLNENGLNPPVERHRPDDRITHMFLLPEETCPIQKAIHKWKVKAFAVVLIAPVIGH